MTNRVKAFLVIMIVVLVVVAWAWGGDILAWVGQVADSSWETRDEKIWKELGVADPDDFQVLPPEAPREAPWWDPFGVTSWYAETLAGLGWAAWGAALLALAVGFGLPRAWPGAGPIQSGISIALCVLLFIGYLMGFGLFSLPTLLALALAVFDLWGPAFRWVVVAIAALRGGP